MGALEEVEPSRYGPLRDAVDMAPTYELTDREMIRDARGRSAAGGRLRVHELGGKTGGSGSGLGLGGGWNQVAGGPVYAASARSDQLLLYEAFDFWRVGR
jgi:hypothetical protein